MALVVLEGYQNFRDQMEVYWDSLDGSVEVAIPGLEAESLRSNNFYRSSESAGRRAEWLLRLAMLALWSLSLNFIPATR